MNKKMLIPIIIAAVAIVIIVIAIILLSLGSSEENEQEEMDVSSAQSNNTQDQNQTENTVSDPLAEMTEQDVSLYNSAITAYIGESKNGVDVRSMIDTIVTSNINNAGTAGRFISIDASTIDTQTGLIGEAGYTGNSVGYVEGCATNMQNLKGLIDAGKTYDVEATYSASGAIMGVSIKEHVQNSGNSSGGLTPPATNAGREQVQETLQTAITAVTTNYQATNPSGTSRDLATFIKSDLENAGGTTRASIPSNYVISNIVLSGNSLTFVVTVDTVVYNVTFNAIDKTLTVQ